ncbi:MAG TPA: hypothetical protein VFY40_12795 [Blastocatellia bacterium]|nr:hypothetical protein [Blastocatellia bacterium]
MKILASIFLSLLLPAIGANSIVQAQSLSTSQEPHVERFKKKIKEAYSKKKRITVTFKPGTTCIFPMAEQTLDKPTRIGGRVTFISDDYFKVEDRTVFDYEGCKTKYENVQAISRNIGFVRTMKGAREVTVCVITFCWMAF